MYRSILVPLDGSTFAEHALPMAWSIARRSGATLQLVHVHIPIPIGYPEGPVVFDKTLETQNRELMRTYLDGVGIRLAAHPDVPITSTLLDGVGTIAETLNSYVKATGVDLVVMAAHGHGGLTRLWLGSVADKLMRQADRPILLVRPQEGTEEAPDLNREQVLKHILIPLDGSLLAEEVLEHAVTFGKLMQADYTLLRVMEPWRPVSYLPTEYSIGLDQQLKEQLQADAQTYLDGVAERLRAQSLQVQTRVVIHQQPAIAILEEVRRGGIDLIAMATYGWGGATRLLVGSVTDKVVRAASTPVLLHRPRGEAL